MKQIIIFSDLHSLFNPTFSYPKIFIEQLIHAYPDVLIISLGDMDCPNNDIFEEYKSRVLFIRGNNDDNILECFEELYYASFGLTSLQRNVSNIQCDSCKFTIENISFYALHGHNIGVNSHPVSTKEWKVYKKTLNDIRKRNQCDYLLYGHTHTLDIDSRYKLINPGSCNEVLCVNNPSYIEIQIENKKIKIIEHII